MYGIFGFVGEEPDQLMLWKAAVASGTRGPHAMGISHLSGDRIITRRWLDRADLREKLPVSPLIIGHLQLATSGLLSVATQPVATDQMAVALRADCDSETLLDLAGQDWDETVGDSLADRMRAAIWTFIDTDDEYDHARAMDATAPGALLAIDRGELVAMRWGRRYGHPLYVIERPEGAYFSSRRIDYASNGGGGIQQGRLLDYDRTLVWSALVPA